MEETPMTEGTEETPVVEGTEEEMPKTEEMPAEGAEAPAEETPAA